MGKILNYVTLPVLFIGSILLQLFVFNDISIFGVKPNMLLISVILIGLNTNIYVSTIYSFILGIVVDLLFGCTGMFTISYTIVGIILGYISDGYMNDGFLSLLLLSTLGIVVFEIVGYIESMISLSKFISLFFLLKQLIFSLILDVIILALIYMLLDKIKRKINEKQNKFYW